MFKAILENISQYVQLSDVESADFCALFSLRKIKKRSFLIREGDLCIHESYINKGCFRNYIIDEDGLEHNFYFSIEDWWVSDLYSRTFNTPSLINIVAVEDCEVLQIHQDALDQFMLQCPKIERFFRIAFQKSTAMRQHQLLQQLHMSAEERYKDFRRQYPGFDQRIPQKQIATYLGITPEYFYTIKNKIIKKS